MDQEACFEWQKSAMLDPNSTGYAVACARYLKKDETGKVIETPAEMLWRVARAVAAAEENYGLFQACSVDELAERYNSIMVRGELAASSPILMSAGREQGACSACYVLPVPDDLTGIMKTASDAAKIQANNGGTGFCFSRIRPAGDHVGSTGGTTSGPIPFIRMMSTTTEAIQQGAKRRGANMGILDVWHPDILEFTNLKQKLGDLSNFNMSVAASDPFMQAVRSNPEQPHMVRNPRTGKTYPLMKKDGTPCTVGEIFELIAQRAWESGEPGLIFIDRVNADNPTAHVSAIEATNPCGEQPLPPYESCNLASINLLSFAYTRGGYPEFASGRLREVVHLGVRFLDNVIDMNRYPLPEVQAATLGNRRIGLGVMGLADLLFAMRIPYDSEHGVEFAREVMEIVYEEACRTSEQLAEERGCFPNWKGSTWEQSGVRMRNATTTCVAPTGTISILTGCSSGIEPVYALSYFRNILSGNRFTEINPVFESTARKRNFYSPALMDAIAEEGSVQSMSHIPADVRRVFVTAYDIAPEWHVRMQAAIQTRCDAGVSKTINLPASATVEDVRQVFLMADQMGCKGITIYRNGSRPDQPMAISSKPADAPKTSDKAAHAIPMDLPEIMTAIRVKQATPFGNMHVKVVVDPKTGCERELFAQLGKGGELASADLEAICRVVSLFLRVNGRIEEIVKQLDGIGTSLSIPTKDGRIASLADGLAKAVQKYLQARKAAGLETLLMGKADLSKIQQGLRTATEAPPVIPTDHGARGYRVKCMCGGDLVFEEGCVKCHSCGHAEC
jgi:ribonucleoside-diphosphate reductase alpha chain